MPPPRALQRREAQRRQRERHRRHAELGIDEDIQRIGANARRDLRRPPARHVPQMIGSRGDSLA
jgi:hypothetical protein